MCWSEDWQPNCWGVEMAIFSRCFPNFLISLLSLSYTVVLLLFPLATLSFCLCLAFRLSSSSPVLWRQVPGTGKQQPTDPSGDQGWWGRVPVWSQRRGSGWDRFCGHRCGGQRWVHRKFLMSCEKRLYNQTEQRLKEILQEFRNVFPWRLKQDKGSASLDHSFGRLKKDPRCSTGFVVSLITLITAERRSNWSWHNL